MATRQWAHHHKKKWKSVTSLKGGVFLIFAFHHTLKKSYLVQDTFLLFHPSCYCKQSLLFLNNWFVSNLPRLLFKLMG